MILRALDGKIITNGFWEDILMDLKDTIRSIKDFPEEGIIFRDITTLLKDPKALKLAVDTIEEKLDGVDYDL